ncbi:MAG: 30S ribosomal protein S6 [Endomicrobium sp.]|jgi:small subunit ribosomal protein S6|nr:30S ribosomal protein S6 [Endomicrobium sp.]
MNYESTFIISLKLSAEKVEELIAKVLEIIKTSKGTVKTVQQLGKKKLAYPVKKAQEGNYVYIEFSGESAIVGALENFFKFNDSVMRFLTVKAEDKKVVAKSASKQIDKSAETNAVELKQGEPVKANAGEVKKDAPDQSCSSANGTEAEMDAAELKQDMPIKMNSGEVKQDESVKSAAKKLSLA